MRQQSRWRCPADRPGCRAACGGQERRQAMYPQLVDVTGIVGVRIRDPLVGWRSDDDSEHLAAVNPNDELIVFTWDRNQDWRATNITTITGQTVQGSLTRWQRWGPDYTTEFLAGRNERGDLIVFYSYMGGHLAVWQNDNAHAFDLSALPPERRFFDDLASWQSPFGTNEYIAGQGLDGHLAGC